MDQALWDVNLEAFWWAIIGYFKNNGEDVYSESDKEDVEAKLDEAYEIWKAKYGDPDGKK